MKPACRAAVEEAQRIGIEVGDPVVIQETNHTVMWLRPHAIIAKVATRPDGVEGLLLEHRVAGELDRRGAPVAAPLAGESPARHRETGYVVSFWERLERDESTEPSDAQGGESLRRVHDALSTIEGPLPSFRVGLARAFAAVSDDRALSALDWPSRESLRGAFGALLSEVDRRSFAERALHGEPHDENLLLTPSGCRWIDFEGCCRGPLEWDLAFLPGGALDAFGTIDRDLIALFRLVNSARVATWCWVRYQFPEMRWHAHHHLDVVRHWWQQASGERPLAPPPQPDRHWPPHRRPQAQR